MLETLATGRWLHRRRIVAVAAISLMATVSVIAFLFATASGTRDFAGRPLGTDFSNIWSAGWMALHGQAPLAWHWPAQAAVQAAVHQDAAIPFYGWHYPPPFLLVAATLAIMPYTVALILWQVLTLAGALWLVSRIIPGRVALLAAAGAPVVFVCLGHGHNGFLTAALFGGGLLLLDRRPLLAGVMLGCLVYKPQFAILLPLVLLAAARPRAIAGAALSSGALVAATFAIWGWPVWQAFLDSLPLTRSVVIEGGGTGWHKIQTAFGATRALGGSIAFAYAVQSAVTLAALTGAVLGTLRAAPALRNAIVLIAALLSTPYALDYDYTLAGVAIAFLCADASQRGFLRWEKTLLAVCWATPLFARQIAELTLLPLGFASAMALFALASHRILTFDGEAVRAWPFRRSHEASAP